MRTIIEYCTRNARHGIHHLMMKMEAKDEYDIVEYGCLGNCGQCYDKPYVYVDGDIVSAENVEKLEFHISKHLQDKEVLYQLLEDHIQDDG